MMVMDLVLLDMVVVKKMEKIVESKIKKCRKCKSTHLLFIEQWNGASITWEVIDGKFDRNDGNLLDGDPVYVLIRCWDCKYEWRVRGSLQIDDLVKD